MLRGNKVLTSLKFKGCGIRPESLSELCSALEVNTTLTELNLSDNRFDDHSLAIFGTLLIITVAVMTVSEEVVNSWYNVSYARQLYYSMNIQIHEIQECKPIIIYLQIK